MHCVLELVPARRMHVRLHVLVSRQLLNAEQVEVVHVLHVAHRQKGRIEPDVVASLEFVDGVLVLGQHFLGETQSEVGPMRPFLVARLHLDHHGGTVVCEVDAVLVVHADPYYVPVPTHALVVVHSFELLLRMHCILHIRVIPAVTSVL